MELLLIIAGIALIFIGEKQGLLRKVGWLVLIVGIVIFSTAFFKGLRGSLDKQGAKSLTEVFSKNVSEARIKANEEVAVVNCKIICFACWQYNRAMEEVPFSLKEMGDTNPPFINSKLAKATIPDFSYQGYFYAYERLGPHNFVLFAKPKEMNVTGKNIFFVDETGKVRLDDVNGTVVAETQP